MPAQADINYTGYELGINLGRGAIVEHFSGKPVSSSRFREYGVDPLDVLGEEWTGRHRDEFDDLVDDGTIEEVVELAKNFMDGIEDGVRSALARWLRAYKASFD